ncbi:MAG: metal ABC transporter substrate-binding protein [Candidatus Limnocylindrales bacterium]
MTMSRSWPRLRFSLIQRLACVAIGASLLVGACVGTSNERPAAGGVLDVVTSTTVFADLVAQVGGDALTVTSLVPKGGVVETFDPTPSDLRAVAAADLIVMNGLGLDDWLQPVIEDSGSTAPIVVLAPDLPGVEYQTNENPDEPQNPHLWLDVGYAIKYVDRITDALIAAAPAGAEQFRASAATYRERLGALDTEIRTRIGAIPEADRLIVSFHEAFPYFAAAYGLTIVGTIVDAPGQDPSAGEIATLVAAIRASGAKAVFGEAQFSPDLVQTVADEANVVVETDLYNDSLGEPPVDTYEGLIRWDVDRVVEALGG